MGKSSIATLVSVQLANDITEMLDRRAKARGVSRSRYAAMIFESWRDKKYPALDTVDSTARAVVSQEIAAGKSRAQENNQERRSPTRHIAQTHEDERQALIAKLPKPKPRAA